MFFSLYSRILTQRITEFMEDQLEEAQCGFRKGRSTQDLIFTFRQIMEKKIEYGKELHVCFVDLEKAFDRVPRNML